MNIYNLLATLPDTEPPDVPDTTEEDGEEASLFRGCPEENEE